MKKRLFRIKPKTGEESAPSLSEKLARAFEIPGDVIGGSPKVTSIGRGEVLIENFKGILDFKDGMIRINSNNGIIKITGQDLKIREITSEEIIIGGKISNIDYDA